VQQPNTAPAINTLLRAASNPSDIRSTIAVPVSMVFEAPKAESVSLVGDFNDWDATATPLHRFGTDGPWTATVFAKPGRHTYAFLVNGTTLVADPRAPRAKDIDYGTEASVLLVNPQ
jgi:1,4-alpha-glucan branching enzyme